MAVFPQQKGMFNLKQLWDDIVEFLLWLGFFLLFMLGIGLFIYGVAAGGAVALAAGLIVWLVLQ